MKNLFFSTIAALLLASCGSNELTREEAFQIIKRDYPYPQIYDFDLFRGDPEHAKLVIDLGLESNGLVTVKKTQSLSEVGQPLIHLTDKAQPYLLPQSEEDRKIYMQKVKIADRELVEITGIKSESDGKNALVEYKISYKNVSPFAPLVQHDLKQPALRKAYFSRYDDGWRLEKRK